MSQISIYRNAKDSTSLEVQDIFQFLEDVRSGKYKDLVERIRNESDIATRKHLKESCPMVTISGTFSKRRRADLIKHSGLICIDIDNIAPHFFVKLAEDIWTDKYVYAAFKSISGNGIAVIIQIDPLRHEDAFEGLARYFAENYQIAIDRSCKDITRARFISYDPSMWVNTKSVLFKSYIPKKETSQTLPAPVFSSKDFHNTIEYIVTNKINITNDNYHDWFRIGFALADEFDEVGREYFHTISQYSIKYNPEIADMQYTNCLKGRGTGITIASFFYYCKQHSVPFRSKQTEDAVQICNQARRQNRTKDSAYKVLTEINRMDPEEATEIIEKAFERDFVPEPSNNPAEFIEFYLRANHTLRRNCISRRFEDDGKILTDEDINTIFINISKSNPKVQDKMFRTYLNSSYIESYHPIREWFTHNAHKQPQNAIKELVSCISGYNGYDYEGNYYPDFIEKFMTKFMLGLIAGALGDQIPPLIPILWGKEIGIGKTFFWENLLPSPLSNDFFTFSDLAEKKDDDILLSQKWLVCDDEWSGKMSKDTKFMKAKAGQSRFSLRRAYGHQHEDIKRLAMLCGTSNNNDLVEEASNRRIIPIHAQNIDLQKFKSIDKSDVLIEAYHLYTSAGESPFLNSKENELLSMLSKSNATPDSNEEIVDRFYSPYDPEAENANLTEYQELTATQITESIMENSAWKPNPTQIGRALAKMKFIQQVKYSSGSSTKRVYLVIPKFIPKNNITAFTE